MTLITVISTEDFQIPWNVLSLSFSERASGKWQLGLKDFYQNYFISNDCIQLDIHLQHLIKTIYLYSNLTFFVRFLSAAIKACSNFSNIRVK